MSQNKWLKLRQGKIALQPYIIREKVIQAIRHFFINKQFHEIIAPVLNEALPLEPTLYHFSTKWQTLASTKDLFLPLSPESALKKALAAGVGNCFSIGHSFRNLEAAGSYHSPEFLMLEWYRQDASYEQIMQDIQQLIIFTKKEIDKFLQQDYSPKLIYQNKSYDLEKNWLRISLEQVMRDYAQLDLKEVLQLVELKKFAKHKGYSVKDATWEQLFNQIFINEVEPNLPDQAFFLIDFPAKISPLCKKDEDRPYLAERFEFYLAGMELANGNNEQLDADLVKKHFLQEKQFRQKKNLVCPKIDLDFLKALNLLQQSKKPYAGVGLGVDRLAMLLADVTDINQINF